MLTTNSTDIDPVITKAIVEAMDRLQAGQKLDLEELIASLPSTLPEEKKEMVRLAVGVTRMLLNLENTRHEAELLER